MAPWVLELASLVVGLDPAHAAAEPRGAEPGHERPAGASARPSGGAEPAGGQASGEEWREPEHGDGQCALCKRAAVVGQAPPASSSQTREARPQQSQEKTAEQAPCVPGASIHSSQRYLELRSSAGSTHAPSILGSSSAGSERGWASAIGSTAWDKMKYGSDIRPYFHYAFASSDASLLSRFLELSEVGEIAGQSVKLLIRTIRFLHQCAYSREDICCVLAHASVYFIDAFALCGSTMSASEVGNVLATLMYIAHCWTQDETCPLHIWHQNLFRPYCPLKTLDAAIMRLIEIRHYLLRVEDTELTRRFNILLQASEPYFSEPRSTSNAEQTRVPYASFWKKSYSTSLGLSSCVKRGDD